MENKKQIVRPFDETQINEHAAKVGGRRNLKEVVITTDDEFEFHFLVKKPSRAVMQAVTDAESKKNTESIQKLMLGCVLEGDATAYENDGAVYVQLLTAIGQLIHTAKGEVKKL